MKLIEAYRGSLTRVVIEARDGDKTDIQCFPSGSYRVCSGACGLEGAHRCENWQIKSKPGDGNWSPSEVQNVLDEVSGECAQATPIVALEGQYSVQTTNQWQNHLNVKHIHSIDYIHAMINSELSLGGFNLTYRNDIVARFADFYIRVLKSEKEVDATTERLQSEIGFKHEFWNGKVPDHIPNPENILIINRRISREELGEIPPLNGCDIKDVFSDDLTVLKQDLPRCRAASLVSVFDHDPETIAFVEDICRHPHSGVKLVISPDETHNHLYSKALSTSIPRPPSFIDIVGGVKWDIQHYQRFWRRIHTEGR